MGILKSNLAKNIGVYALGNALNGAIPFLLLPVLTTYLSKESYGILANLELILGLCMPLIGLNTGTALGRYFFDLDRDKYSAMVFNYMVLLITVSAIASVSLLAFDSYIAQHLEIPPHTLWVVIIIAFCKQVLETRLTIYRVQQKPVGFSLLRILSTAFDLSLSIVLVVLINQSWEGRFYAQLMAYAAFAVVSIFLLIKHGWIRLEYSKKQLKQIVHFGVPLIPHAFGGVLLAFGDRWIITQELGISETGIYFVGYQVGMVMSLIQTSFNQAWSPWFYKQLTTPVAGIKTKIVKITYLYSIGLLILAGLLYLLVPAIFKYFIGSSFSHAEAVVGWVLLGYAFNGVYKMMVNYLLFLKKTTIIGVLTIFTAGLNIALNFWLIPDRGIIGAAQATLIAFVFQLLVVSIIASNSYKMPWNLRGGKG